MSTASEGLFSLEPTLQGDRVVGKGGGQAGNVSAQTAVAAPGQVGPVGVPAGRLLLDPALPALEAVPALAQTVQQAAQVIPQLHTQTIGVTSNF